MIKQAPVLSLILSVMCFSNTALAVDSKLESMAGKRFMTEELLSDELGMTCSQAAARVASKFEYATGLKVYSNKCTSSDGVAHRVHFTYASTNGIDLRHFTLNNVGTLGYSDLAACRADLSNQVSTFEQANGRTAVAAFCIQDYGYIVPSFTYFEPNPNVDYVYARTGRIYFMDGLTSSIDLETPILQRIAYQNGTVISKDTSNPAAPRVSFYGITDFTIWATAISVNQTPAECESFLSTITAPSVSLKGCSQQGGVTYGQVVVPDAGEISHWVDKYADAASCAADLSRVQGILVNELEWTVSQALCVEDVNYGNFSIIGLP